MPYLYRYAAVEHKDVGPERESGGVLPRDVPVLSLVDPPPSDESDADSLHLSIHSSESESDGETDIVHHVPFKVMGAARNSEVQIVLKDLSNLTETELYDIPLRLRHEQDNIFDENAIAFECFMDSWKGIGYIVSEALPDVHEAIHNNEIIHTKLQYVKFKTAWQRSGAPAYFASVIISKKGKWPSNVVKHKSTL